MVDAKNKATFPGLYTSLGKIAAFIRDASKQAGFDSATSYQIELAVDEAVTNIIEHAYGGENEGDIECAYHIDRKGLTIYLRDNGQPFQPENIATPDISAPIENRNNHGLGLFMIRELMDQVFFEFNQKTGNCLKLVKHKD